MSKIVGWFAEWLKRTEHRLDEPHGGYRRVPANGAPMWLRRLRGSAYSLANWLNGYRHMTE